MTELPLLRHTSRRRALQFVRLALWILGSLLMVISIRIAIEIIAAQAYYIRTNDQIASFKPSADQLEHGAYLARAGNCAGCHTARGGQAFAGGKALQTPFGAVYTSNITPHPTQGIGMWTAEAFYRAMHEGISASGRLLTPAFPYANYTHVTRQDSDALYAYFMYAVAPAAQTNRAHELPFPLNTQLALAAWRIMFFDRAEPEIATKLIASKEIPERTSESFNRSLSPLGSTTAVDELARGAYLVRGLGHCSACHANRNALGAAVNDQVLSGALMPMQDWYAPSLISAKEAGVGHWPREDIVALLQTGVSPRASAIGPMAEVVAQSTQHLSQKDLYAMAGYLQSLPQAGTATASTTLLAASGVAKSTAYLRGADLYTQHCATCHGEQGQGVVLQARGASQVALPAFAGNRAITMARSTNLVRMIVAGGYAPSTAGNPRPYGMPPFVHVLTDDDIASVATYIRNAWGNQASSVSAADVVQQRKGLLR